jgi:hypothetical protein
LLLLDNPLDEATAAAPQPWVPEPGGTCSGDGGFDVRRSAAVPALPLMGRLCDLLGAPHNYDGFPRGDETAAGCTGGGAQSAAVEDVEPSTTRQPKAAPRAPDEDWAALEVSGPPLQGNTSAVPCASIKQRGLPCLCD